MNHKIVIDEEKVSITAGSFDAAVRIFARETVLKSIKFDTLRAVECNAFMPLYWKRISMGWNVSYEINVEVMDIPLVLYLVCSEENCLNARLRFKESEVTVSEACKSIYSDFLVTQERLREMFSWHDSF